MPAGVALFCGWLALGGGEALAPFHAEQAWSRHFVGPYVGAWDGLVAGFDGVRQLVSMQTHHVYFTIAGGNPYIAAGHNLMELAFLILAVPAVVGVLRRLPLAYGAYVLAALALPLSYPVAPQPLMSIPRYLVVLFPLAIWLAAWLAERPAPAATAAGAVGAADGLLRRPVRHLALGGVAMDERTASGASALEPSLEAPVASPGADGSAPLQPRNRSRATPGITRHRLARPGARRSRSWAGSSSQRSEASLVDLPALLFGVEITSSHTPPGLSIADTFVQDLAFVLAAVLCAHIGGRAVRAWQFGLRPPGVGWRSAVRMIVLLLVAFLRHQRHLVGSLQPHQREAARSSSAPTKARCCSCSAQGSPASSRRSARRSCSAATSSPRCATGTARCPPRSSRASCSAACTRAPPPPSTSCRSPASASGLCLLYRYTGSLYPCIAAHSLNNSIAFSALENWSWQAPVLIVCALGGSCSDRARLKAHGLQRLGDPDRPLGHVGSVP